MKLWGKVYLLTLLIFLLFINISIYLIFDMTYKKDVRVEQDRAESTYHMIQSNICDKLLTLSKNTSLSNQQLKAVLETYEAYYEKEEISLTLSADKPTTQQTSISFFTANGVKTVRICSRLGMGSDDYTLTFSQPLREFTRTWNRLWIKYLCMSIVISALLALLLFLVLRRLMKPIQNLTDTVKKIETGDYTARVESKGSDDIALLSNSVNAMAETISLDQTKLREEANQKQTFIDNFSHELKSPLTSIQGFAEYLEHANTTEQDQHECLQFIQKETARLLHLSYTLLDMAKIRQQDIEKTQVELDPLLKQITTRYRKSLEEKNIILTYPISELTLHGNEWLLESLLSNLIGNAILACQEGDTITVSCVSHPNETVLTIQDTGCGMDKSELSHITEPFYRVDKSRSRKQGGTGLGLSLCQEIIQAHNGTMTFDSTPGKGTLVTITIS